MTSNNTWDYFDASSDKNRVVWYWIASVVQSTIDLGTNFSVATGVNDRRIGGGHRDFVSLP